MARVSSTPWTQPSSPHAPCRALKHDVGLERGQHLGEVAAGVDAADPGAQPLQRVGAGRAGDQADLALGRQAAHQDGDVKAFESAAIRPDCAYMFDRPSTFAPQLTPS